MGFLVSIVIPTYNRAELLPVSVRSVIAQTYRPLELVVVNDGSKDNTPEIMNGLEQEAQAAGIQTRFVHQDNGGLATARRVGAEAATGDYFGYLDDDDTIEPEKIARQVAELQRTGADCCCCYLLKITPTGTERHPNEKKKLMTGVNPGDYVAGRSYAHINSLLIARRLWNEVGGFDPDLKIAEDVEWVARLTHVAKFCAVEEVLGRYEFTEEALSRADSLEEVIEQDRSMEKALLRIRERNKDRENWDEVSWRQRVADVFDEIVKHLLYAGRRSEAAEKWRWAMRATGGHEKLKRTRRKLRKARWLALVGKRLRHPKFSDHAELRM